MSKEATFLAYIYGFNELFMFHVKILRKAVQKGKPIISILEHLFQNNPYNTCNNVQPENYLKRIPCTLPYIHNVSLHIH